MATKTTFNALNLKIDKTYNTITFNDKQIKIAKYLPIEDKIDLIQNAFQKSLEGGIFNDLKLDMYFNLGIIYLYTDITFTEKQREDEFKLYDSFQSTGLLDMIIQAIDESEYDALLGYLKQMKQDIITYKNSAAALIQTFVQDLPKNAEAAANIVDNFDPNKYQQLLGLAKSTGFNQTT